MKGPIGRILSDMTDQEIKVAVAERYGQVARTPAAKFNFPGATLPRRPRQPRDTPHRGGELCSNVRPVRRWRLTVGHRERSGRPFAGAPGALPMRRIVRRLMAVWRNSSGDSLVRCLNATRIRSALAKPAK